MALALLLVFRSRWRLLPLAIALAAAALTFGLLRLFGGSLTMASIAVLPILIGLAVDYAIQFQARFDEASDGRSRPARGGAPPRAGGGPTIAIACLATAAGFLALQLSPIPMVRSFGLLLIVGIALGLGLALTAGFAALGLRPRKGGGGAPPLAGFFAAAFPALAEWWGEKQDAARIRGTPSSRPSALGARARPPEGVLAVGAALAVDWVGTRYSDRHGLRYAIAGATGVARDQGPETGAGRDGGVGAAGGGG